MAGVELTYRCSFCSFRCLSWREYNRHSFETHSNDSNFVMKCVVAGCSQTFRCYSTFSSHLSRKHRGVDFESEGRISILSCNSCSHESEDVNDLNSCDVNISTTMESEMMDTGITGAGDAELVSNNPDVSQTQDCTEGSTRFSRFASLFLLTVKERYQLTQSALDFITKQIQQMISFAVDDIDTTIRNYLAEQGLNKIPVLDQQLEALRNPFAHIQTEYLQNKYFRENFNLVVSLLYIYVSIHIISYQFLIGIYYNQTRRTFK